MGLMIKEGHLSEDSCRAQLHGKRGRFVASVRTFDGADHDEWILEQKLRGGGVSKL